jgi:2-iminobutanoate/2-iminopropanoate deaminase
MERFAPVDMKPVLRTGVRAGDWLAVSGQVGHADYTLVGEGIAEQFRQAMTNLRDVVLAHGASMKNVVKVNIYLADINDFEMVSEMYREFVDEDHLPARTAIAAVLPFGALVEVEGWALLPGIEGSRTR